jgi:hypothetical protein
MVIVNEAPIGSKIIVRPPVTSYDSGYEHSLEHWFEVRRLVDEANGAFEAGLGFGPQHLSRCLKLSRKPLSSTSRTMSRSICLWATSTSDKTSTSGGEYVGFQRRWIREQSLLVMSQQQPQSAGTEACEGVIGAVAYDDRYSRADYDARDLRVR